MTRRGKYPAEVRDRAVRLALEHRSEYPSEWAALSSIAAKCGMTTETLRKWVRQARADAGKSVSLASDRVPTWWARAAAGA